MTKRKFAWLALAGAALSALLAVSAASHAEAQTIKIGIINTYSGPAAAVGDEMDKGLSLYVKLHEKDLPPGVKVELIKKDDGGPNPDVGKRLAQELITRDQVQFISAVIWTPTGFAIAPMVEEAKVVFISSNAAGVALPRASKYIARTSFTLWQQAYPLGKWAAQHGYKTAYTATSDFAPGHESAEAFAKGFTDGGGKVLDQVFFPVANPDFTPYLQRVKDAKPNVVFFFVPGGTQAPAILKAYNDLGMKKAGITAIGTQDIVPDEQLPSIGDSAIGLITAGIYSAAGNRPANKAFLAAWTKEYGDKQAPDFFAVDSYDAMNLIFDVIKHQNGKFDPDQAMEFIKTWKNPNSPRGPISIDPATRDIVQNVYIRRVQKVNGKLANVEIDTIKDVKDPWKEMNPPK